MRLIDRLFAEKFNPGILTEAEVRVTLSKSQFVVADNVANYWRTMPPDYLPSPSDFPNVMLPFEYTFIEMRWPKVRFSEHVIESTAVLLWMEQARELEVKKSTGVMMTGLEVKHHLHGLVFLSHRTEEPRLMSRFILPVSQEGQVVADKAHGGQIGYAITFIQKEIPGVSDEQLHSLQNSLMTTSVMPALLTLSFMHCRNVTVRKEMPPLPLSRKHQKRTGKPLLRYHVLQIDHMKQVLEREGGASTEGLKKALHICRGHFKHYGRDGKGLLFGKHVATVWIPMHTRGSIEEGMVVKDYHVK